MLLIILVCSACNIPAANKNVPASEVEAEYIWDLSRSIPFSDPTDKPRYGVPVSRTPTPQLYKAIDFEQAFINSREEYSTGSQKVFSGKDDKAEWLYFDPAEYSTGPLETLYAVFTNTGESTWTNDYFLEFYAGRNPSETDQIKLDAAASPGKQGMFRIPISSDQSSWKSCWHLKNDRNETFFDFCYNHGSGVNINMQQSAQNSSGSSGGFDPSHPFYKFSGTAPSKYSDSNLSADFVSTSPNTGHTFRAYDHTETLTVSFKNNGNETWDSSYSLVFYSGYNWMHTNSFSLQGSAAQGETAVFSLPMEIYEDNDKWVTCWYLAAPDGKNLSDFCFNYYTRS